MSQETSKWLNTNTLIGYTEKRGNAWHYRADDQGTESNHYVGPVPVADVKRRLFDWEPERVPMVVTSAASKITYGKNGDRIIYGHPHTGAILGAAKTSYTHHGYKATLLDALQDVIKDDVNIGSAGLLKGGAQAWVQVETEATWFAAGDVQFRPFLFAADSINGSMATTYGVGNQLIVCDNTLAAATMEEGGRRFKIRHTINSLSKINDAAAALGIIHSVGEDFQREVELLLAEKVPARVFNKWVDIYSGMINKGKDAEPSRGLTLAENKKEALVRLYNKDERVAPWKGTAFGVLQCANTYEHHIAFSRGQSTADRNAARMINTGAGSVAAMDANALSILAGVR